MFVSFLLLTHTDRETYNRLSGNAQVLLRSVVCRRPLYQATAKMSDIPKTLPGQTPLAEHDPELLDLIKCEKERQRSGLELIASENFTSLAVNQCLGSCLTNKYSEGLPGGRYYGGQQFIDKVQSEPKPRPKPRPKPKPSKKKKKKRGGAGEEHWHSRPNSATKTQGKRQSCRDPATATCRRTPFIPMLVVLYRWPFWFPPFQFLSCFRLRTCAVTVPWLPSTSTRSSGESTSSPTVAAPPTSPCTLVCRECVCASV